MSDYDQCRRIWTDYTNQSRDLIRRDLRELNAALDRLDAAHASPPWRTDDFAAALSCARHVARLLWTANQPLIEPSAKLGSTELTTPHIIPGGAAPCPAPTTATA